jgi:hypothetical protein
MNISRREAVEALAAAEHTDRRVETIRSYSDAAPYLLLWGAVWFVANVASDFFRSESGTIWLVATLAGSLVTVIQTVRLSRNRTRLALHSAEDGRRIGRSFAMLGATILSYFVAMAIILGPFGSRRLNAFVSLSWALAYMAAGARLGTRLFVTGAVTALAIVFGYRFIQEHFGLWMAFFAGGSLMLAGFWLRKV